jgi:hypothetical protein
MLTKIKPNSIFYFSFILGMPPYFAQRASIWGRAKPGYTIASVPPPANALNFRGVVLPLYVPHAGQKSHIGMVSRYLSMLFNKKHKKIFEK